MANNHIHIEKGYPLESIGVTGYAYSKTEALKVCHSYFMLGLPISGGDVYVRNNGLLEITYENWYYCSGIDETFPEYVQRSYEKAVHYIRNYPDNDNYLFHIIVDDKSLNTGLIGNKNKVCDLLNEKLNDYEAVE